MSTVTEMSVEQLEKLLNQKKKQQQEDRLRKKAQYEQAKNELVIRLCGNAKGINELLREFKMQAFEDLGQFYDRMKEYGDVRGEKGSFQLVSADDKLKVLFSRETRMGLDERAELAETKLKEFLSTTVKKRDKGLHDVILGLLERNGATNDFDVKLIGKLIKLEDNFDDESWKEAIRLFKESIRENGTADYVRLYERDSNEKWQLINLNMASV